MSTQSDAKAAEIIDYFGGPSAFARLLGLQSRHATQRVSNWRTRGIPAAVIVKHRKFFDSAERALNSRRKAEAEA
jgi:hypothetical protein